MKHVKLFEDFNPNKNRSINTGSYKVIGVFAETQMAVGVFPSSEADSIYSVLSELIPANQDHIDIEMTDLPSDHDLVVVPLGGKGISTTNYSELENYNGEPVTDVVELGKVYDYGDSDQMVFNADRGLKGFVVVDSAGGTRLLEPNQIEDIIY